MKLSGKLKDISIDFESRKPVISFIVDQQIHGIESYREKELSIDVKQASKPRSLNANRYFHLLCDRLRQKNHVSMAAEKNDLITMYGQLEIFDNVPLVYKTNAPPQYMAEREEIHMKYIKTGPDGTYFYRVYRGSHTYNVEEMRLLLDGTITECKAAGIETEPPEEIERLLRAWGN